MDSEFTVVETATHTAQRAALEAKSRNASAMEEAAERTEAKAEEAERYEKPSHRNQARMALEKIANSLVIRTI